MMQDFAATTGTMIHRDLVPYEWLAVAVVSLTVNACILLRAVVSRGINYLVRRSSSRRTSWPEPVDCEGAIARRQTWKNNRCDEVFVSA